MARFVLLALLPLAGCKGWLDGLGPALDGLFAPPNASDTVDEAMEATAGELTEILRALGYLPEALEDPGVAIREGFEIGPPDAAGRRAWRLERNLPSRASEPTQIEGSAIAFGADAWEVEIIEVESQLEAVIVLRRNSTSEIELIGEGYFASPLHVQTCFRSAEGRPYTLVRSTRGFPPSFLVGDIGCLELEVLYLGDSLEATGCFDELEPRYGDVVRNGIPDPDGLRK